MDFETEKFGADAALRGSDSVSQVLHNASFDTAILHTNKLVNHSDETNAGAAGLINGLADGAINQPAKAVQQMFGAKVDLAVAPSDDTQSHRVGQIVGSLLPFVGLSLLTRGASARLIGETASPTMMRLMGEQATAGFVLGSAFTPSADLKSGDNLLGARLNQGVVMAATFATMSGSASLLNRNLPEFASGVVPKIARNMTIGAASGAFAGVVDAEVRSGFQAKSSDLISSSLGYAAFGAIAESSGSIAKSIFNERTAANTSQAEIAKSTFSEHTAASTTQAEIANLASAKSALRPQPDALSLLAADPTTTVISSPAGWYDKLNAAIYKSPSESSIIVTQERWLKEAQLIAKNARRSDLKIILDENGANAKTGQAKLQQTKPEQTKPLAAAENATTNPPVELSAADKWEQRSRLIDNIKREVRTEGQNPADALVEALKKSRAVMVGEYHVQDSPNRLLGAESMPQLKEAGLTHLAIEHSSDFAGKIFKEGKLDIQNLPELLQHREFYTLLEAAKKEGIEVVPVDGSYNATRNLLFRNEHMDQQIAQILENPKNKVLYWVGNRHLQTLDSTGEGPQVAQLLRDRNIPVTTFYGQHDNFWREEPMRKLYSPDKAIAVPTDKAPTISSLNWLHSDQTGHDVHRFDEFNYVLMYPEQRAYHYD